MRYGRHLFVEAAASGWLEVAVKGVVQAGTRYLPGMKDLLWLPWQTAVCNPCCAPHIGAGCENPN